jgi:guanylate kinase
VLVNEDAGACLDKVHSILEAERMKRSRRIGLTDFVRGLIG